MIRVMFLFLAVLPPLAAQELTRRHLVFVIEHPMKTVEGTAADIRVTGLSLSRKGSALSADRFQVTVPVQGMNTGNRNRDSTMQAMLGRTEWVAEIEPVSAASSGTFTGILRLGTKSAPLRSDFTVTEEAGQAVVRGSLIVKLSDYAIEAPRLLMLPVADEVKVTYEFTIKLPG